MATVTARNDTNSPFTVFDVNDDAVTFSAMGGTATGDIIGDQLAQLELMALSGNVREGVPVNTVAPAITGTAQVGQTLTRTNGTWVGDATITFATAWYASGVVIPGATASTYQPVVGDIGDTITVVITATNGKGVATATSAATAAVIAA